MSAYQDTSVPVDKSQAAIRSMLRKYGADHFAFSESADLAEVAFRSGVLAVRMRVPIRPMTAEAARAVARQRKRKQDTAESDRWESETRRVWRVLYWLLKSRMEAIDAGVETFEQAFLAHLLDPRSDRTVYETMADAGALKQLEAGPS